MVLARSTVSRGAPPRWLGRHPAAGRRQPVALVLRSQSSDEVSEAPRAGSSQDQALDHAADHDWRVVGASFAVSALLLAGTFYSSRVLGVSPLVAIRGDSMEPTLLDGDLVLLSLEASGAVARGTKPWSPGDVVAFRPPLRVLELAARDQRARRASGGGRAPQRGDLLVKRVAAVPGDVVDVDSQAAPPAEWTEGRAPEPGRHARRLPGQCLWVLGDNAAASADSRLWGGLPTEEVVGRVVWRLWPRFGPLPAAPERAARQVELSSADQLLPESILCSKPGSADFAKAAEAPLRPGVLLRATPGNLDARFRDARVLIVDRGDGGTVGVVVNRRMLAESALDWERRLAENKQPSRLRRGEAFLKLAAVPGVSVHYGGPVGAGLFPCAGRHFVLHPFGDLRGALPVLPEEQPSTASPQPGLYMSLPGGPRAAPDLEALLARVEAADAPTRQRVAIFVGCASWSPLQLAAELEGVGAASAGPAWYVESRAPTLRQLEKALSAAG